MVIGLVLLTGLAVYAGAKQHKKKKLEKRARREAAGGVVVQKGDQKLTGERQGKRRRRWLLSRHGSRHHQAADHATNHAAIIELPGSYSDDVPPPYRKFSNESVHSLSKQQLSPSAA